MPILSCLTTNPVRILPTHYVSAVYSADAGLLATGSNELLAYAAIGPFQQGSGMDT